MSDVDEMLRGCVFMGILAAVAAIAILFEGWFTDKFDEGDDEE